MGTVLVTGGCGYIGSHTCICLIRAGYKILILDSLINSYKSSYSNILNTLKSEGIDYINKINFIEGDLRDKKLLSRLFSNKQKEGDPIFSVVHFAGLKSIEASIKSPLLYWEANVESTLCLLSVMEKYECYSIIFSSSASVYKPSNFGLLNEKDFVEPSSPYGRTKLTVEMVLRDLYKSSFKKWRIANLRYFNPVGAHEKGLMCEKPKENRSNLFPAISRVVKKEQEKLFIFGNDWPTYDGTCIRDFIHVMDLAEAHTATLDYLIKKEPNFLTLNIGTGIGSSILEIIEKFKEIGVDLPCSYVKKRPGDYPFLVADNKLALKLLNWAPKRELIDMCKDSINNVLC